MTESPRFVLPGTWGRIDLRSNARMERTIRQLVERTLGRADSLAAVRGELRGRFRSAVELAMTQGAVDFYVSLELAPGVPLPAWLAVILPAFESDEFARLGGSEVADALTRQLTLSEPRGAEPVLRLAPEASASTEATSRDPISAVRQVVHRTEPAVDEVPSMDILRVDYWLAATSPNRVALLSFSTALAELEEPLLGLFDAIVGTARWPLATPAKSPHLVTEGMA